MLGVLSDRASKYWLLLSVGYGTFLVVPLIVLGMAAFGVVIGMHETIMRPAVVAEAVAQALYWRMSRVVKVERTGGRA